MEKTKVKWLYPIWGNIKYKVGIEYTGESYQYVGQITELILALKPNHDNVYRKYKARLRDEIDEKDFEQILWVVTLDLLRTWKPKKSAFGTYLRNYLWKRSLDVMKKRAEHPYDTDFCIEEGRPYRQGEYTDDENY